MPVSCGREHPVISSLDRLYVLCLKAFRALRDIEPYLLAFLQAAEAARLNLREMHEDIFATMLTSGQVEIQIGYPVGLAILRPLTTERHREHGTGCCRSRK